jgi:hypothetical protein
MPAAANTFGNAQLAFIKAFDNGFNGIGIFAAKKVISEGSCLPRHLQSFF